MVLLHFSSTARQQRCGHLAHKRPRLPVPAPRQPHNALVVVAPRTPARSSGPRSASRYCCGARGRRGRSAHRDEVKQPLLGPLRGHVGSARDASAAKARRLLDGAPPRERGKRRRRQAGAASRLQHARMRHAGEVHQRQPSASGTCGTTLPWRWREGRAAPARRSRRARAAARAAPAARRAVLGARPRS